MSLRIFSGFIGTPTTAPSSKTEKTRTFARGFFQDTTPPLQLETRKAWGRSGRRSTERSGDGKNAPDGEVIAAGKAGERHARLAEDRDQQRDERERGQRKQSRKEHRRE